MTMQDESQVKSAVDAAKKQAETAVKETDKAADSAVKNLALCIKTLRKAFPL